MTITEFIEKIKMVLDKPGMFRVESVDDISLFVTWEIHMRGNKEVSDFFAEFTRYIENEQFKSLHDFGWNKIIRLYSGSNSHSLILFGQYLNDFLGDNLIASMTATV